MYVQGLKKCEVRLLRFEVVEYKDGQTIKIYDSKKEIGKQILIFQELYDEIIENKNYLTATKISHNDNRHTKKSNWLRAFYTLWFKRINYKDI